MRLHLDMKGTLPASLLVGILLGSACRDKPGTGDTSPCSFLMFNKSVSGTAQVVPGQSYQGVETTVFDQFKPTFVSRYCVFDRVMEAGRGDVAQGCDGCDFAFVFDSVQRKGEISADSVDCSYFHYGDNEKAYAFDTDYSESGGEPRPTWLVKTNKYRPEAEWEPANTYYPDAGATFSKSGQFSYSGYGDGVDEQALGACM